MSISLLLGLAACDSVMPRIHFNEPPGAPAVHLEPEEPGTGDLVQVVFDAEAADPEGDSLDYTYTWYRGSEEWVATSAILDPTATTRGDAWRVEVRATDGEWTGEAATASVLIVNTPPVTTAVLFTPEAPTGDEDLVVEPYGQDDDGDEITWLLDWTVDGVARPDVTNLTTIPADETVAGETWNAWVRPYDGFEVGEATALSTYIDNTKPIIGSVTTRPTEPKALDLISAFAEDVVDPDGNQALAYTWSWYVDGALVETDETTTETATLNGPFTRGQQVWVTVVVNDGWVDSELVSSEYATIVNTPPSITDATIDPGTGTEATTFTCTPSGGTDEDGDDIDYDYVWWVNGAVESTGGDLLLPSHFAKGDTVQCEITPTDGLDDGDPQESAVATVENSPPEIASVTLSPTSPVEGNTVTATLSGNTDADGDAITYTYSWNVSGTVVAVTGSSLSSNWFARGDTLTLTVTPDDGEDRGTAAVSATVTVANAPPTASGVSVSPSNPTTSDTLSCSVGSSFDADGDTVSYRYQWYDDSVAISGATSSTLAASYTTRGDRIYCQVTPNDGADDGTATNSSIVNITNATPAASAEVVDDTSSLEECDEIELDASGSTDADGDSLTYAWTLSSKPSLSRRTTSDITDTTDEQPTFLLDAAGTFTFQVAANDTYVSGTDTVSVTVSERASNTDPVADAGSDAESSGFGTCNFSGYGYTCSACTGDTFDLDASGSYDDDEDPLTYVWTTTSPYATIADSGDETTTITLANMPATHDETTTYEASVRLRVIDCAGGSSESYVTVSFDCTGI